MKKLFWFYVHDKILFIFCISFFLGLVTTSISSAHKVNIFAYVEGGKVYTESYFPDGRKVEGGTVEVYDSQENKLLSGITDKEGKFNFTPPKKDDLKIVLIATMGHKNSYLLSASELANLSTSGESKTESGNGQPSETETTAPDSQEQPPAALESASQPLSYVQADLEDIKRIVDQSLDQKLAPIIRELAKSQQEEKLSATEIFGGIGYIFGLMGLILYFTKKKA